MMNDILKLLLPLVMSLSIGTAVGAPPDAVITDTNAVEWVEGPEPGIVLKRLVGALARINLVRYEAGIISAPHRHATEQMMLIQSGRYKFTLGEEGEEEERILEAGDFIVLPSYSLHGVEALEASEHIAIFAPAALPQ